MKIDFDSLILDLKGNTVVSGEEGKPLTVGDVCCLALQATHPDEQSLDGGEKVKRFKLATKIVDGGVIDVTAEEIILLKQLTGKTFTTVVVGRVWEILEK